MCYISWRCRRHCCADYRKADGHRPKQTTSITAMFSCTAEYDSSVAVRGWLVFVQRQSFLLRWSLVSSTGVSTQARFNFSDLNNKLRVNPLCVRTPALPLVCGNIAHGGRLRSMAGFVGLFTYFWCVVVAGERDGHTKQHGVICCTTHVRNRTFMYEALTIVYRISYSATSRRGVGWGGILIGTHSRSDDSSSSNSSGSL